MEYSQQESGWQCNNCSRIFTSRQAVTSHIHRAHTNPGVSYGGHRIGKPAWNKGLTKDKDRRVARPKQIGKKFGAALTGHSEETKRKLSMIMSSNNRGGRSKWFEVSKQKVQGTWERNIAQKLDEMNIRWEKLKTNKHTFEYEMNGKIKNYTPDFFLRDYNVYLEIKGYWWGQDREKMKIVLEKYSNIKFVIVEKREYEKILQGELVW